jgi:hypothetical protein
MKWMSKVTRIESISSQPDRTQRLIAWAYGVSFPKSPPAVRDCSAIPIKSGVSKTFRQAFKGAPPRYFQRGMYSVSYGIERARAPVRVRFTFNYGVVLLPVSRFASSKTCISMNGIYRYRPTSKRSSIASHLHSNAPLERLRCRRP